MIGPTDSRAPQLTIGIGVGIIALILGAWWGFSASAVIGWIDIVTVILIALAIAVLCQLRRGAVRRELGAHSAALAAKFPGARIVACDRADDLCAHIAARGGAIGTSGRLMLVLSQEELSLWSGHRELEPVLREPYSAFLSAWVGPVQVGSRVVPGVIINSATESPRLSLPLLDAQGRVARTPAELESWSEDLGDRIVHA